MTTHRAFLHVGAPKSGTTYLQGRLAANARSLAAAGLVVPTPSLTTPRPRAHFRAALDLLDQDWGGPPGHAVGAWSQLLEVVAGAAGDVVISHEILAPATAPVARRALADLAGTGREVHVVYSARDLAGALTSAWQESVKQGRRWTFARFLELAEERKGWWFRALDLPRVLESWGADLTPDRIHLVTVPPRDPAGSEVLWQRFCSVLAVDPATAPHTPAASNPSLGVLETQLVRRLNERTGRERVDHLRAERLVSLLGRGGLAERRSPRLAFPPARHAWAAAEAETWRRWVGEHPLTLHGSLDDLVPAPPVPDWTDPDVVDERALLGRATEVTRQWDATPAQRLLRARQAARRARLLVTGNG